LLREFHVTAATSDGASIEHYRLLISLNRVLRDRR
jgi:hypothetical protein